MNVHQIHLLQLGLESLGLSLLVYFLFSDKATREQTWRALFNLESIRNWSKERILRTLTRQTVAFFFYSGLFLVAVAMV